MEAGDVVALKDGSNAIIIESEKTWGSLGLRVMNFNGKTPLISEQSIDYVIGHISYLEGALNALLKKDPKAKKCKTSEIAEHNVY